MLKTVETVSDATEIEKAEVEQPKKRSFLVQFARAFIQIVLMLAVIAGAYVVMNQLIAAKPERTARPQFEVTLPVQAATVELGDQRPVVRLFGQIAAARAIDIRPSVSGEVVSVNADLSAGTHVEAGEELFTVDRFNFEAALSEAKTNIAQTDATIAENTARLSSERAQLEFAENQLALAKADLERAQQLRRNGTLTQKQVDDRLLIVSQREQAAQQRRNNIAIEEARAAQQVAIRDRQALGLERAERDLKNTVVRAPFAGVIRSSTVEIGRIVSANDVAVAMYDDSALDVRFTLTDAQYGRIAIDGDPLIGRNVNLVWSVGGTQYAYDGKVTRIGADVASERGGVDVFARLNDNDDVPVQLRPGAFVEVAVPDRLYANAARVPETAIFNSDTAYVIVDGKLQTRKIKLAAFDGADAVVAEGLADGDMVLTTRISEIEEGLKVSLVDADGVAVAGQETQPEPQATPQGGGRPSPELIAAAKKISGLSDEAWDALPREERRPHIQKAREAAAQ